MHKKSTLERALELAKSGSCQNLTELRVQLKREQHDAVDQHLSGFSIQKQLKELLAAKQKTAA